MLTDLVLKDNYSSDDSNILEELIRPCLGEAEIYYRSVGYLDSKMLGLLGAEFEALSIKGGIARLLVGRTVSFEDYIAIKQGKLNPERFLEFPDLESLWVDTRNDETKRRGILVLSWLVARGTLSIRFSIRPKGIHHDKFAYFRDSDTNEVVVHGTNNETEAANVPDFNYESLSVFRSWEPLLFKRHGNYKLQEFLRLWEGDSKSALAIDPPNPVLEKIAILADRPDARSSFPALFDQLRRAKERQEWLPRLPLFWGNHRYALLPHQKRAVNAFIKNDYCGILALATGSGKTITALHAATELARTIAQENNADVFVIVAVPYQVLADQWIENFIAFGYSPIRAYESAGQWFDRFNHAVNAATFEPIARVTSIVVVNRTLQSDVFQNLLSQISPQQTIFIGDECHRLGSSIQSRKCPLAEYRIGLSATPWAPHEFELKDTLESYFGKTVAHYGLTDAFRDKVLVPYNYKIVQVRLSDEEGEAYTEHTKNVKRLLAIKFGGGEINENELNFHRNKQAAIVGSVSQKFEMLPLVLTEVKQLVGLGHLLIYCGSGSTDVDDLSAESIRDIERAQLVSSNTVKLQSARITASESPSMRQSILRAFGAGSLNAVFAIKVLDEGFDMPGVRGAVLLASSRNERQFIQRRGRVLRSAENKSHAAIWDFFVSGNGVMPSAYASELSEMELLRCIEFSRFSIDWEEIRPTLESYADEAGLSFDELYQRVIETRYEVAADE